MMRVSKVLGSLLAVGVALVAIATTTDSRAGDETLLTVSCAQGNVTVTPADPWHANEKAPWGWDKGEKVMINHQHAKFKGTTCEGTIKAYICKGESECRGPIKLAVH